MLSAVSNINGAAQNPWEPMPRGPNAYRLQSRQLFLTYPRFNGDFNLEDILQHLGEILADHQPPYIIQEYIIANEQHADGGRHIHAYLKLDKKCSIACPHFLDLWGNHGSYEGVRSPKAVKEYCSKENDWISNFFQKKTTFGDVLGAKSKEEFFELAAEADPRGFIYNQRQLDYFADKRFGVRSQYTPAYSLNSFRVHGELNEWFRVAFNRQGGRGTPLILESPSRYGKTEYIRTLLHSSNVEYVYMNSMFNADSFPVNLSNVRFIVLDDFTVETFFKFAWKPFWGCQRQFTITDKYKAKRDLIFPVPWSLIWLCNPGQNPLNQNVFVPNDAREYLEQQNTRCITLERPLFEE